MTTMTKTSRKTPDEICPEVELEGSSEVAAGSIERCA